jgi:hypothetical protein
MNLHTITEIESMLSPNVKIISADTWGKWIKCQVSREFGDGDISISFKNW